MEVRREWSGIFMIMKYNCQPCILYPAKLSFKFEKTTKPVPNIQRQQELAITRHTLEELLKGVSQRKKQEYLTLSKVTHSETDPETQIIDIWDNFDL